MWSEGTYQYPPLYFFILAVASSLLGNEVLALKITAVFTICLLPLTTYTLAKKLFDDDLSALVAAWVVSIPPIAVEMLGWGGYPNLLGLTFLPLAFRSILCLIEKPNFKNVTRSLLLTLTIVLTHHLTFLIFFGTLTLWVLALGILQMKRKFASVAFSLLSALAIFVTYRVLFAWPPQFILSNEAAYYFPNFTVSFGTIMWIFKDVILLSFLSIIAFASVILLLKEKFELSKTSFLVAWLVTPIIMSQGHLLGLPLDYPRIFIFMFQPFLLLVALPLSLPKVFAEKISFKRLGLDFMGYLNCFKQKKNRRKWIFSGKRLVVYGLMFLSVSTTLMTLTRGVETVKNVDSLYNSIDHYGDHAKLDLTDWILKNTNAEDVFVAEEQSGRWIEGLAIRPVLMYQKPAFLFMKGEAERAYDARKIFTSTYGIKNGFTWIFDQAPLSTFSPMIAFKHLGDYENLLYLDMNSTQVDWSKENG